MISTPDKMRPILLSTFLSALVAIGACDGKTAGNGECEFQCDAITEGSVCLGDDQLRYCQELIQCDGYPGQWRIVDCANECANAQLSVLDATELVYDHCGTEDHEVIDGAGECWCLDPHSGNLIAVHPPYGW